MTLTEAGAGTIESSSFKLVEDPELHSQIGYAARQTILKRFTMTRMMDEIESFLQEVACASLHQEATH